MMLNPLTGPLEGHLNLQSLRKPGIFGITPNPLFLILNLHSRLRRKRGIRLLLPS
ncbi:hypothetical protein Hanom_Chr08g00725171 [Helianthus anomalus]